ncbi:hypothetical protein HZB02_03995 [Candidatus Woesearchaeota archaeon]|nr:hypothetical protein [Candidatus Woesearchaeota archaeon]
MNAKQMMITSSAAAILFVLLTIVISKDMGIALRTSFMLLAIFIFPVFLLPKSWTLTEKLALGPGITIAILVLLAYGTSTILHLPLTPGTSMTLVTLTIAAVSGIGIMLNTIQQNKK